MSAVKALAVYRAHRRGFTRAMYASLLASFGIRLYYNMRPSQAKSDRHVAVDRRFIQNLLRLLRIAVPKFSKETFLVVLQAGLLVARTYMSLQVARLDGLVTAALVRGRGREFLIAIAYWMGIGIPASVLNSVIQLVQRTLALRMRSNLTEYAVDRYLGKKPVYYAIQQQNQPTLDIGQLICADIDRFSFSLARLYSNLVKPILDVVTYNYQLSRSIGGDNVFFLGLAIQLSARALRLAAPPFGEFVATEASLEGEFRTRHSRLIEFSEEIALFDGFNVEKMSLDKAFYALMKHISRTLRHRLAYASCEDFVVKYLWGAAGLVLCSVPIFRNIDGANRAQRFVVNRKLLLLSSDAVGRVMSSYKDISSLAGITSRVESLLSAVDELSSNPAKAAKNVEVQDFVEFDGVDIVSPSGELLVKDLSFRISSGEHLLIVGPNGSGKSSLFRVLGGLWPVTTGKLYRPTNRDVFYIPQRPYLSRGSLRQQIIYPSTELENDIGDDDLLKILELLGIDSFGGLDTVKDWRDDLSIGAQQKIAAARLFYHKPKYAILDECTASVTQDTEHTIYTHAQKLGITLLTVSHRASLWKFHNRILQLDGQGGYLFAPLDPQKRLALEEEKLKIDSKLRQVNAAKERLAVLTEARKSQISEI